MQQTNLIEIPSSNQRSNRIKFYIYRQITFGCFNTSLLGHFRQLVNLEGGSAIWLPTFLRGPHTEVQFFLNILKTLKISSLAKF